MGFLPFPQAATGKWTVALPQSHPDELPASPACTPHPHARLHRTYCPVRLAVRIRSVRSHASERRQFCSVRTIVKDVTAGAVCEEDTGAQFSL